MDAVHDLRWPLWKTFSSKIIFDPNISDAYRQKFCRQQKIHRFLQTTIIWVDQGAFETCLIAETAQMTWNNWMFVPMKFEGLNDLVVFHGR